MATLLTGLGDGAGLPAPSAAGYRGDFPDPAVLRVGGTYWAYATGTGGAHVPVLRSGDLRAWHPPASASGESEVVDALPRPARWGVPWGADGGKQVWAPAVARLRGRYVLFYSLRVRAGPRRFCLSVAISRTPMGPFTDDTGGPLVCDADPAGSIDPAPFVDPRTGRAWLLWKSEGDRRGVPTRVWIRALRADGAGFASGSRARELLRTSLRWEGPLIEGPSMIRFRGSLYLFYSANVWRSARYATGVARCATPIGPCQKAPAPLLASHGAILGPGGASALLGPRRRLMLAYHHWDAPDTDYPDPATCASPAACASRGRRLAVARLRLDSAGWPQVD